MLRCNYYEDMRSPEVTPHALYYFWIFHKGRILFLSSYGKKTFQELGIEHGDEIAAGGVHFGESSQNATNASEVKETKTNKKKSKMKRTKKKKSQPNHVPILSEQHMMEQNREDHSRAMIPVFEELGPLLKGVRLVSAI